MAYSQRKTMLKYIKLHNTKRAFFLAIPCIIRLSRSPRHHEPS
jgi:hypothetical protein